MKKLLIPAFTLLIGTAFVTTACRGVIFDTIRDEIALDDAQVTGDINSIVRFKMKNVTITTTETDSDGNETTTTTTEDREYLFVQNGNIWMKDVNDAATGTPTTEEPETGYNGNWTQIGKPAANIIKLAADSTYLYALAAPTESDDDDSGENIETGRIVYYTTTPEDSSSWTAITFGDYGSTISTSYAVSLFCTNTPQEANRHAYVNIGSTAIYELAGGTATDITDSTSYSYVTTTTITDGAVTASAKSAAILNGTVYFSPYYAMTTNETLFTDSTYFYYANGDYLYYCDGSTATQDSSDPGDSIYAMSYTSDYLILGTDEGLVYVALSDEIPGSTATLTNESSTLSSYYEVWAVLAVDPSQTAAAGDAYGATTFSGTSASFSNVCLWAYYQGRGKWNCE